MLCPNKDKHPSGDEDEELIPCPVNRKPDGYWCHICNKSFDLELNKN